MWCNIEANSSKHCRSGKAIHSTYYEHVSASLHLFCVVLCCHLLSAGFYHTFPRYFISSIRIEKKDYESKTRAIIFSTTFVWNIFQPKKNSAVHYHKYVRVFLESRCLSCQILMPLEYSRQIFEEYPDFMKIRPVGAEWFHADRQTDGRTGGRTDATQLIVAFCNFANATKIMRVCLSKTSSFNAVQGSNRCLFRRMYKARHYIANKSRINEGVLYTVVTLL
jgi:hypothetical protein